MLSWEMNSWGEPSGSRKYTPVPRPLAPPRGTGPGSTDTWWMGDGMGDVI